MHWLAGPWGIALLAYFLLKKKKSDDVLTFEPLDVGAVPDLDENGAADGSVEALAREAAERHGVAPRLLLATAQVESGFRTEPRSYGDSGTPTWRPYGLKQIAAADHVPFLDYPGDKEELAYLLDDLGENTELAAERLSLFDERYDGDLDLIRVAWAWGPGTANRVKRGELALASLKDSAGVPYPDGAGVRWAEALDRWA